MAKDLAQGNFCTHSQTWVVLPFERRHRSRWNNKWVVGFPGFDGVEFQMDEDSPNIFAFFPNTGEMGVVANNLFDLTTLWESDSIQFPF